MRSKKISILFMVLTAILWNPTFEITKGLLSSLGPATIIWIRFLIALPTVWVLKKIMGNNEKIKPDDYRLFILISICGILHYLLSNISNVTLSSAELMTFSSFQAIITLIFASLFLNIVITPKMSFCVGLSSIGAVLTLNISQIYNLSVYLYMLLAMLFWVLYCILVIKLFSKYNIITIIYYEVIISVIFLLPLIFFEKNNISALTIKNINQLLFMGSLGIGICFIFNAYSLKHIGPITVSIFMNIGPIIINLINSLINNEKLDLVSAIGIAMIYMGTIITLYNIGKMEKYTL